MVVVRHRHLPTKDGEDRGSIKEGLDTDEAAVDHVVVVVVAVTTIVVVDDTVVETTTVNEAGPVVLSADTAAVVVVGDAIENGTEPNGDDESHTRDHECGSTRLQTDCTGIGIGRSTTEGRRNQRTASVR